MRRTALLSDREIRCSRLEDPVVEWMARSRMEREAADGGLPAIGHTVVSELDGFETEQRASSSNRSDYLVKQNGRLVGLAEKKTLRNGSHRFYVTWVRRQCATSAQMSVRRRAPRSRRPSAAPARRKTTASCGRDGPPGSSDDPPPGAPRAWKGLTRGEAKHLRPASAQAVISGA